MVIGQAHQPFYNLNMHLRACALLINIIRTVIKPKRKRCYFFFYKIFLSFLAATPLLLAY
jgi:hypothetical protein